MDYVAAALSCHWCNIIRDSITPNLQVCAPSTNCELVWLPEITGKPTAIVNMEITSHFVVYIEWLMFHQ